MDLQKYRDLLLKEQEKLMRYLKKQVEEENVWGMNGIPRKILKNGPILPMQKMTSLLKQGRS